MPRKRRGKQYRLLELKLLEKLLTTIEDCLKLLTTIEDCLKLLTTIEDCLKQIDTIDLSKQQSIAQLPKIAATLNHAATKYKREHLKE